MVHEPGIINQLWITAQLFFQLRIMIEILVGVRQRVRAIVGDDAIRFVGLRGS